MSAVLTPAPGFLATRNAAAYLDMKPAEFTTLVAAGALPGPVAFGRWDRQQLDRIMRGEAAKPRAEDVEV